MRTLVATTWTLVFASIGSALETPSVSASTAKPPESVSAAIAGLLDSTSYTLEAAGEEIAHVWVRKIVPTKAASDFITNDTVSFGEVIGVIEIRTAEMTDFRGQELPEGVFVMRMGRHPQDGNHMGISPFQEYLCLCPSAIDQTAETVDRETVMEQSAKALETGHPAVLYMQPIFDPAGQQYPSVGSNEMENVVVYLKATAEIADGSEADYPFGFVIIGETDAE